MAETFRVDWPRGFGRSHGARLSGTEYMTPRMPPMAITATDSQ